MLISDERLFEVLKKYNINIKGVLHIGAHTCEELSLYNRMGIESKNIIWIDANDRLTQANLERGITNCYTAALDEDEKETYFNITNNNASSSLLNLGTHLQYYPHINYIEKILVKTQKLSTFVKNNNINISEFNFWNLDIQGSELHVLRGSEELLKYADCLYLEINLEELYTNCGLVNELDIFLEKNGFMRVVTEISHAKWGDAIYVRKIS